ncbi:MAG: helix-turn-helix domain-containing protein [Defluviitaleaceae bacterium]|nr:helix-turn-helix domain-containing protein [Defluviitaleaceae bacterium]
MEKHTTEWVSIDDAVKILGISRKVIDSHIENGEIPFRQSGRRRILNVKLVRAALYKIDIANMERVQKNIAVLPMSRAKVTGNANLRNNRRVSLRIDE